MQSDVYVTVVQTFSLEVCEKLRMDSSEEISDNILSYLLESARDSDSSMIIEGENVSTATDNNDVSELDNSLNPLTSPSLTSAFSSKKLEWDSSADVGCLPDRKPPVKSKLSALERMALSNSASRLCLDEDEKSLALIAKIDRVLARSKSLSKVSRKPSRKIQKLPTWPSIDSGSNASVDTVIPFLPQMKSVNNVPYESQQEKCVEPNVKLPSPQQIANSDYYKSNSQKRSHASQVGKPRPPLQRSKSIPQYEDECESELFITRSVAGEELDLYASNDLQDVSVPVTPTNFVNSDREQDSNQCRCVSDDYSETTCPTHTSLSSEHTRRLRREALGELQMYKGLKEHLKNLKDYVSQLEQTWKFLDSTKSAAAHPRAREDVSSTVERHSRRKTKPVPTFDELPTPSMSCHTSAGESTPVNSITSLKSDRSFELERLNLHDTDSTEESRPTRKPNPKCCNHCSLKVKSSPSAHKRGNHEKGVQTSDHRSRGAPPVPTNVVVPQREPIAYDISLDAHHQRVKPQEERPKSKTTLQEALKEKRPDFYQDSERRRKLLQEIQEMRRSGTADSNPPPHMFTYQELRKHTEQLYRQLPEYRNRNKNQQRKETVVTNRIKASLFQKKLQSRVLQGQLNLPHSTCL